MRRAFLQVTSGLLGLFPVVSALAVTQKAPEAVAPEPLPASRYEAMVQKSPFAVATPAAPVQEAAPNFAANLYVMGVARLRDAEGKEKDFVTIKSRADQTSFSLSGTDPNRDGIALSGVEWNERVGKSKVIIRKGTEYATLEFDQANLHAPPPAAAPGQRGMPVPGLPGGQPHATNRPGGPGSPAMVPQQPGNGAVPAASVPPQSSGPIIPRPPVNPQVNAQVPSGPVANPSGPVINPNAVPGPGGNKDSRKRVRLIGNPPGQ